MVAHAIITSRIMFVVGARRDVVTATNTAFAVLVIAIPPPIHGLIEAKVVVTTPSRPTFGGFRVPRMRRYELHIALCVSFYDVLLLLLIRLLLTSLLA